MFFIALLAPLIFGSTDQYIQRHNRQTHHHYKSSTTPPDSKGWYYKHNEAGSVFYDSIPQFKK